MARSTDNPQGPKHRPSPNPAIEQSTISTTTPDQISDWT